MIAEAGYASAHAGSADIARLLSVTAAQRSHSSYLRSRTSRRSGLCFGSESTSGTHSKTHTHNSLSPWQAQASRHLPALELLS